MEMTRTKVPLGEYVPSADTVFLMDGVSWDEFETLLAIRGERSRPMHVLGAASYTTRERSVCLPRIDLDVLTRLALVEPTSAAIKKLRAALRS